MEQAKSSICFASGDFSKTEYISEQAESGATVVLFKISGWCEKYAVTTISF